MYNYIEHYTSCINQYNAHVVNVYHLFIALSEYIGSRCVSVPHWPGIS